MKHGMSRPSSFSVEQLETMSVEELEHAVKHHNQRYWDQAQPEISDYDYDQLVLQLKRVHPASLVLEEMGPSEAPDAGSAVTHQTPMLSLDKCYTAEELNSWAAKFEGDVMVTPKMDGIAASLRYDPSGRLQQAATRGNGFEGDDITRNVRTIMDLPDTLAQDHLPQGFLPQGPLEVRGEIYMKLSIFSGFADQFSNPRNLTAGAIKHKDPARCRAYKLSFAAYDLQGAELATEQEKLDLLVSMGFSPMTYRVSHRHGLQAAYEHFAALRDDLDFEIDGVVFKTNSVREQRRLGVTAHHPRFGMAYKFQGDSGTTTLNRVDWSVARSGVITPVAHIEPVVLSGATVSRASLHNAGFLNKLGLRGRPSGAKVVVTRRGGVIPKVEFVSEPALENKAGVIIDFPATCPSCGGKVIEQGDFLYCANPQSCRDALIAAIAHFCGVLDLLGFGDKLLHQAYDRELLKSPADLYTLTTGSLQRLERVGSKLATKLIREVDEHRTVTLATFLRALGIDELGRHVSRILADNYQTLERVQQVSEAELAAIHTIGTEIASSVVAGLREQEPLITALLAHLTIEGPGEGDAPPQGGPLTGMSFVFTGTLIHDDRKSAQKKVKALGGATPDGVTKTLTYLVVGDGAEKRKSSKQSKAEKYIAAGAPLKIIRESDFLKLIG